MKTSRISASTFLILLLGFVLPAFAGQDKPAQDRDHPKQQNTRQQQARPKQQTHQQKPSAQTQRRPAQQQVQHQQQNQRAVARPRTHQQQGQRASGQQRTQQTQQFRQTAWQQHRAGNWQADHRTWQQRGGYKGYRIPDARFQGYFGPDHGFRIQGLPFLVVGGYPRFQYRGYWLSVVDPWPSTWGPNWYDSDEVYVIYAANGYYLYNRSYPGVGLAVSISL